MFPYTKKAIQELAERRGKELLGKTELEAAQIIDGVAGYRKLKIGSLMAALEPDLSTKTFVVTENLTVADLFLCDAVWNQWKGIKDADKISKFPNVTRWMNLIQRRIDAAIKEDGIAADDWSLVSVDLTAAPVANAEEVKVEKKEKADKKPAVKEEPAGPDPSRISLKVGHILKVGRHENADSLYVETIDLGEAEPRTVCSGLVKWLKEEDLLGKRVVCVCNLKPAKMRGVESSAMLLAATSPDETKLQLLLPPQDAKPGSRVFIAGFESAPEPEAVLNPKKKQWEAVQPGYKIDADGEAVWEHEGKAAKFVVEGGGVCKLADKEGMVGSSIR